MEDAFTSAPRGRSVDGVPNRGVERARGALDDHAQLGGRCSSHLVADSGEGLAEVEAVALAGAQAAHRAAPFLDDLRDQLLHAREQRAARRPLGHLPDGHVQLHRGAHEALQQGVVQLARDPRPLREALVEERIEPPRHLPNAPAVGEPRRRHRGQERGELEPPRLPGPQARRSPRAPPSGPFHSPSPPTRRRGTRTARREVGVDRFRGGNRLAPARVEAVEAVAEAHALRRREAHAAPGEAHAPLARRDTHAARRRQQAASPP
jgi:hypothetical protein